MKDISSLQLTDFDKFLFAQGTYEKAYEKLGAHEAVQNGVKGVHFAVWAPNANRVDVIGNFSYWQGDPQYSLHPTESGIWNGFIPHLKEGDLYKFLVYTKFHGNLEKADPFAFQSEMRPKTGSVVSNIDNFHWHDAEWMQKRPQIQALDRPMSIYEVHLGSWKRNCPSEQGDGFLNYRDLAHQLVDHAKYLGFTHIQLLPISEHPFDGSWGYQTMGYFSPTSRFGSPQDFQYFVDYCHKNEMGVLLDWVPAHFPKDPHGLVFFDGTCLYEHTDPRQGEHQEWGTKIFNYNRHEVRSFLLAAAVFWGEKYHIDGFRTDAVSSMLYLDYSRQSGEWIPNEFGGNENLAAIQFLRKFNETVHGLFPGFLSVAEESTAWPMVSKPTYMGGLGFTLKWNMGWMHDSLCYMGKEAIHRKYHHNDLTFSMLYSFTENFILPLSHDEVVHGKGSLIDKMAGDLWQKFATLRAYFGFMWGHPGKKLLFMGSEFAQWQEWRSHQSLDWHLLDFPSHRGVFNLVRDLNGLHQYETALHEIDFDWHGFEWISANDSDNSIFAFIRRGHKYEDELLFICNFTPVPRYDYRVGVNYEGYYKEILNTDADIYWGANMGNAGGVWSGYDWANGKAFSINITIPPLSTLVFKRI